MTTACMLVMFAIAQPAPERCTVSVWSYQTEPIRWTHCHSWVTFQRGSEKFCISWYPKEAPDSLGAVVDGENKTHEWTLKYAAKSEAVVRHYGPYEITPELYQAARSWERALSTGKVKYVGISRREYPEAVNCIHAAASCGGWMPGVLLWGDVASRAIVRHLSHSFVRQK